MTVEFESKIQQKIKTAWSAIQKTAAIDLAKELSETGTFRFAPETLTVRTVVDGSGEALYPSLVNTDGWGKSRTARYRAPIVDIGGEKHFVVWTQDEQDQYDGEVVQNLAQPGSYVERTDLNGNVERIYPDEQGECHNFRPEHCRHLHVFAAGGNVHVKGTGRPGEIASISIMKPPEAPYQPATPSKPYRVCLDKGEVVMVVSGPARGVRGVIDRVLPGSQQPMFQLTLDREVNGKRTLVVLRSGIKEVEARSS